MKIEEIQPQVVENFGHILENEKLSHAYLFTGGFGSFELALWLSQSIFCEQPINHQACKVCRACRLVESQEFVDLHIIKPDGQTIKTAQIRELSEVFNQSGYENSAKVIIIEQAEKMHTNAANSLLKSIEEPEGKTYIFLLTDNENMVLPTIKSRTQVVNFPKNIHYVQNFLETNGLLKSQAELLSQLSGSPQQLLNIGLASWFQEGMNKLEKLLDLIKTNPREAYLYLTQCADFFDDKEKQSFALEVLLILFNQDRLINEIEKTFKVIKMWKSNVRFISCLEYIVL
ncbi:MAG: DNA polymerase III subunit delta' [Streptococcaceae bacterium]|nr:DNA polymerase III subunit delta' [Streptococcaceae bacterium]